MYCPDITTSLKSHNLSTTTFDEAYWKAYWPIVNEPVLKVRDVMMKVDKERRENEMKKMSVLLLEEAST